MLRRSIISSVKFVERCSLTADHKKEMNTPHTFCFSKVLCEAKGFCCVSRKPMHLYKFVLSCVRTGHKKILNAPSLEIFKENVRAKEWKL